ncbi:hypothetical protein MTATph1_CDS0217 [Moorella phage MTATph1]
MQVITKFHEKIFIVTEKNGLKNGIKNNILYIYLLV